MPRLTFDVAASNIPAMKHLLNDLGFSPRAPETSQFSEVYRAFPKTFHTKSGILGLDLTEWKSPEHQVGLNEETDAFLDTSRNGEIYWPDETTSPFYKADYRYSQKRTMIYEAVRALLYKVAEHHHRNTKYNKSKPKDTPPPNSATSWMGESGQRTINISDDEDNQHPDPIILVSRFTTESERGPAPEVPRMGEPTFDFSSTVGETGQASIERGTESNNSNMVGKDIYDVPATPDISSVANESSRGTSRGRGVSRGRGRGASRSRGRGRGRGGTSRATVTGKRTRGDDNGPAGTESSRGTKRVRGRGKTVLGSNPVLDGTGDQPMRASPRGRKPLVRPNTATDEQVEHATRSQPGTPVIDGTSAQSQPPSGRPQHSQTPVSTTETLRRSITPAGETTATQRPLPKRPRVIINYHVIFSRNPLGIRLWKPEGNFVEKTVEDVIKELPVADKSNIVGLSFRMEGAHIEATESQVDRTREEEFANTKRLFTRIVDICIGNHAQEGQTLIFDLDIEVMRGDVRSDATQGNKTSFVW